MEVDGNAADVNFVKPVLALVLGEELEEGLEIIKLVVLEVGVDGVL